MQTAISVVRKGAHPLLLAVYGLLLLVAFFPPVSYGTDFTRSVEVDLNTFTTRHLGPELMGYELSPNFVPFDPVNIQSGDTLTFNIDFLGNQKLKLSNSSNGYEAIGVLLANADPSPVLSSNVMVLKFKELEGDYVSDSSNQYSSCDTSCLSAYMGGDLTNSSFSFGGISIIFPYIQVRGSPFIISIDRLSNLYALAGDVRVVGTPEPSLSDIVKGSVSHEVIDNNQMHIKFDPKSKFGLTLDKVASIGGFDHFNWIQVVRKYPGSLAILKDGFCYPILPHVLPYYDPPPRGINCQPADELPFYWDEVADVDGRPLDPELMLDANISGDGRLDFSDIPSNAFTPLFGYMEFWTYLVGVISDKSYVPLWGPLKWKSNYNYLSGSGGVSKSRNVKPFPPGGEGGIFDVEQMTSIYDAPLEVNMLLRDGGASWLDEEDTTAVIVKGNTCAPASFEVVKIALDGTWSYDPDKDPLTYTWTGPFGTLTGEAVTATLPIGTHTITLTVDDGQGNTDSVTTEVTVNLCEINCDITGDGKHDGRDVAGFQKGCKAGTATWLCDVSGDNRYDGRDVATYQQQCLKR